jgi:hypothetical protein
MKGYQRFGCTCYHYFQGEEWSQQVITNKAAMWQKQINYAFSVDCKWSSISSVGNVASYRIHGQCTKCQVK